MKIGQQHLGASKYWWAWLGIRSNPAIAATSQRFDRTILFDDPGLLPPDARTGPKNTKYYCIFWDGIRDPAELERAQLAIGPGADLTGYFQRRRHPASSRSA